MSPRNLKVLAVDSHQGTTRNVYGADNRLQADTLFPGVSCPEQTRVLTDQAGNRLGAVTNDGWAEPTMQLQKMTYTARNQLYFSLTATSVVGQYDANWHWYDGDGLRIMSQTYQASTWNQPFPVAAGYRGYYLYDGSDVALVVQRAVASGAFTVRARYVTGGLDAQWVARLLGPNGTGYVTLALVPDHQGSTVAAVQEGDSLATSVAYCARDAFGGMQPGECTSGAGATNTETGYTGASTPNNRGGFVYLRNRWYDPATGKFLTQDPIGLAGGVNLYAYAGNDPVAFGDPWGLKPGPCKNSLKSAVAALTVACALLDLADNARSHFSHPSSPATNIAQESTKLVEDATENLRLGGKIAVEGAKGSGGPAGGGKTILGEVKVTSPGPSVEATEEVLGAVLEKLAPVVEGASLVGWVAVLATPVSNGTPRTSSGECEVEHWCPNTSNSAGPPRVEASH